MTYRSDFLNLLHARGYIHQTTDAEALDAACASGTVTAYIGYDCTAPSLHVGSLVQIMLQYWAQQCGHRPIVLMGGGTTRVGDPSGKDESRKLIDADGINANMASIKSVFARLLRFGDGPSDAIMVNNADWLDGLEYIPFLRDVGRHFSINRMLTFDSVKLRLDREQPLSFLEFNYMILQAYDFLELSRRHDCRLQMGGSDQWGNIVNGVDLTRRIAGKDVFGLTTPLLTTSDGKKMGKTADGAVWLNEDQLPAYDFWQYWRNVTDADAGRMLRLFTPMPMDEIAKLEALQGAEINEAKKILATEVTTLIRGRDAAEAAAATAQKVFEQGGSGEALPQASASAPIALVDALVLLGLVGGKNEARRLIAQGGARINGEKIGDEKHIIVSAGEYRLSAGQKKHGLLTLV